MATAIAKGESDNASDHRFLFRNAVGRVWNGSAYVDYDEDDFADYGQTATAAGDRVYTATAPSLAYTFELYWWTGDPDTSYAVYDGVLKIQQDTVTDSGDGDTVVDHDTGGTDTLRVVVAGQGVDGVVIRAYVKTEYDANATTATVRGKAITGSDGRWVQPMYLNADVAYTLTFHAASGFFVQSVNITP